MKLTQRLLGFALLLSFITNAQTPPDHAYFMGVGDVTAPEAASLHRFEDIPVSYSTGVPNISIPLFNIGTSDFSLPIGLSYHAGGFKVNTKADFSGLGWTLSGGGVITKNINDKPDHSANGYYNININDELWFDNANTDSSSSSQISNRLKVIDLEPDMFNFSFPGGSGQFHLDENNNAIQVTNSNIKILKTTDGFEITTPNGAIFHFGGTGYTSTSLKDQNKIASVNYYLNKISTPNGYTIDYTYSVEYTETMVSNSESKSVVINNYFPRIGLQSPITIESTTTALKKRRVSRIDYPGGYILFGIGTNTSMFNLDPSLTITNHERFEQFTTYGTLVKAWNLGLGTSGTQTCERKKLFYVQEEGRNSSFKPPYILTYNTNHYLPCETSKSIDHWGYYNSNNSGELIPTYNYEEELVSGANRETNEDRVKADLIESIAYPTGGVTTFDFESNSYGVDDTYEKVVASAGSANITTTYTKLFIIDFKQTVNITTSMSNPSNDPPNAIVKIKRIDPTGLDIIVPISATANTSYYSLTEGEYQIYVDPDAFTTATAIVSYKENGNEIKSIPAGGVRVKTITTSDPDLSNPDMVRSYTYEQENDIDKSSGILLNDLEYSYYYYVPQCQASSITYLQLQHNSGAFSSSNPVEYTTVTETLGANGEGGYTRYHYNVIPDLGIGVFVAPTSKEHLRNRLDKVEVFDANDNLVHKKENSYTTYVSHSDVLGYMTRERVAEFSCSIGGSLPNFTGPEFVSSTHHIEFKQNLLLSTSETQYFTNGTSLANTTNYFYDALADGYTLPTRTRSVASSGIEYLNETTYPFSYSITGTTTQAAAINGLLAKNQLSPIEQYSWKKENGVTTLLNASITEYKEQIDIYTGGVSNTLYLPKYIYATEFSSPIAEASFTKSTTSTSTWTKDSRYQLRATFDDYGIHATPQKFHLENGSFKSIQWDENFGLPLAVCDNAEENDFVFNSFEASSYSNEKSYTGYKSQKIAGSTTQPVGPLLTLTPNQQQGDFKVSFWSYANQNSGSGQIQVKFYKNDGSKLTYLHQQVITTSGYSNWHYNEDVVSLSSIRSMFSVPANNDVVLIVYGLNTTETNEAFYIDELRIHPVNSLMQTYTYNTRQQVASMCDARGNKISFNYDDFLRLKRTLDFEGNILQELEYNLAN